MTKKKPITSNFLGRKMNVRIHRVPWRLDLQFLLTVDPRFHGDKQYVVTDLVVEEFDEDRNGEKISPTFSVDTDNAKFIMDELWRCGVRPSKGEGSVGQLGATEKHLNDVRRLVEKQLEVNLKDKLGEF